MNRFTNTLKKNTMVIALAVVLLLFQILIVRAGKGSLFEPSNVTNIINQNSYVVILACGMLLCILTGGNIDLSVGSTVALIGALAGTLIVNMKVNIFVSILLCLVVGILLGAWQGFWIAYIRIPAFIVTLAGMLTFRGVALLVLNGLTISPFPETYTKYFNSYFPATDNASTIMTVSLIVGAAICLILIISQWFTRNQKKRKEYELESLSIMLIRLAVTCVLIMIVAHLLGKNKGIPVILVLLAVIVLAYYYFTERTVPGRYFYAMGGNEKAAKLSGVNTDRVLFGAYTNMGFLAALAALVCVARFNSAAPSAGTNYEMDAIGACYIGGASAYGGTGTIGGAVIGAIFMGVLNNGMSILGVDANWQKVVKGLVLLAAVIFDVVSKRKSRAN